MKFTGQNKKVKNPRYFLNEAEEGDFRGEKIATYLPTSGKKEGIPGCKGASELQKLLVSNYPVYEMIITSFMSPEDPNFKNVQRLKEMLSDGVIGHYYVLPINAFIEKILGKKREPKNNVNTGYTDDMEGYKAICRDMFDLTQMMIQWEQKDMPSSQESEPELDSMDKDEIVSLPLGSEEGLKGPVRSPEEIGIKKTKLKEAKLRDNSYDRLKNEKNRKLFNALIKG